MAPMLAFPANVPSAARSPDNSSSVCRALVLYRLPKLLTDDSYYFRETQAGETTKVCDAARLR